MKQKLWTGLTVGTVAAGIAALGISTKLSPVHADAAGATAVATITVVGHSEAEVQPDLAVIDAGVTTTGKDAQSAQKANDSAMNRLMDMLKTKGVQAGDVKTMWYNIHPNYGTPDKSGQPTLNGFVANDTIEVRVHDLNQVGGLVDNLVQTGANQINGVSYQLSNPTSYQQQAYQAALQNARNQAESIAKSLGVAITGVQAVDTTNGSGPGPIMYASAASTKADAAISPGTQTVSTDVKVVYTIGNK